MYNLLKNKRLILSLPLFLAASLFLPSHVLPSANAQFTGLVCITPSTSATSCPSSAPTIGPLTPGSTFTVGAFVQGSDAMGGFDVYVRSDPAFVSPTSAALGTLIATPSLTSICINGSAQTGSCTVGTANGNGVVEVTTIESSGSNECGGISPCSGMAFTITYTVLAATPTTSLSYPTAPGCSASSVSSPPNVCVEVADSTGTVLPENIQGATVNIVLTQAVVCIVSPSTATSCPVGTPTIPFPSGSLGTTFTVGVFVQNSAPLGGFNIFVSVDSHYLNPTAASLGTLITSPSLTVRCIDGQSIEGTCDTSINGPGVVQVSTAESSGGNDPGTGLAFSITYQIVGVTPSTPISYATDSTAPGFCFPSSVSSPAPNECVFIGDNVGTTLTETIQEAVVTQPPFVNTTLPGVSCQSPIADFGSTTCIVIITDNSTTGAISPINTNQKPVIKWTSDGFGVFQPVNSCTLQAIGPSQPNKSNCFINYMPVLVGSGIHNIGVIYEGDTVHSGTTAAPPPAVPTAFPLRVVKANVTISTAVVNVQTGQVIGASGVPAGLTVRDTTIMTGGAPPTGVTGTATYTIYPNGGCTAGTGIFVSTVNVGVSDDVPNSDPAMPPLQPPGNSPVTNSFNAVYSGDGNNNGITSSCESFIVTPAPHFAAGKLHWTHHLSLSKSSNTQSWTAIVANPLSTSAKIVIRIVGQSTTNPTHTFDVICGVTCVNTASGGINFTPGLTPVTVAAGTSSLSFNFNQPIPGTFANEKFTFTATLWWATGTLYTHSDSKSGAFAVVP